MMPGRKTLALILAAWGGAAHAGAWPIPAAAGSQSFRYEAMEVSRVSTKGYRTDFSLRSDGRGGVVADIVSSQTYDGKAWTPVVVDDACRKAMDAPPGELARVKLYPLTPDQTRLGDAFLAQCAPAGVFFPLTDILNVVLIVASETFGVRRLAAPGDATGCAGFATSLDRLGLPMTDASEGGPLSLASVDGGQATLDWKPTPSRIEMVETSGASQIRLSGTETFAFRVLVDRRTGSLAGAQSLYDDLDLGVAIATLPPEKRPRLAVKRTVTITPITAR